MLDNPNPTPFGETTAPTPRTAPPAGRRWRGWLLAGAAVLALGAGAGLLHFRGATAPTPAAPPREAMVAPPALTVAVAPVESRPMLRVVIGDGSVVAWQELVIGAELGGLRVVEVAVEEGESVRRGQLLARFDDAVLAAQFAQAEAAVTEAEAALEIAQLDLERARQLSRSAIATRQTLEQRQSAARQAEARLLAARARRDETAARLAQTRVVAPTDGTVSRRSALLGAVVPAGQEMFRLIRDNRLELDARVPELDLAGVSPGQAVRVLHGERMIEARVRMVAPIVAAETRLGLVHVALPEGSGLRPGMFARAEIRSEAPRAIAVPQQAVVFREGAPAVFVLPEGSERVALRRIETGARQEGMVEVASGLRPGERIVLTGAGFLSDGDRVALAPPAERQAAAP
ncbi:efflux RND transporter periplasmic adaptor subunit [Siccirubricoccus sp. G192]|uniref:efflux RND transporter periplasmic adaptor subunit n=1 Tax=Siccirubricoccus sp. G192 TaxID=2849651 RepID=UPI001C2B9EC7|nr:efflux RND transporter periplasmic adaptor subunit [Siccirubricoccus sp. G192]MBV1797945.1 efflux RND transporter periplasmic adaptor subunit [Siccirubricoccus sp. G192]